MSHWVKVEKYQVRLASQQVIGVTVKLGYRGERVVEYSGKFRVA